MITIAQLKTVDAQAHSTSIGENIFFQLNQYSKKLHCFHLYFHFDRSFRRKQMIKHNKK